MLQVVCLADLDEAQNRVRRNQVLSTNLNGRLFATRKDDKYKNKKEIDVSPIIEWLGQAELKPTWDNYNQIKTIIT